MVMLTLSVIVMCSYLYPVCLVSRVLKNTYFQEQFSVVASKYRNLHDVQCLNIAPTEKAWIYEILFYEAAIIMVKDKNRYAVQELHYVNKSKVTRNFIWFRFFRYFYFSILLSIGKGQL